MEVEIEGNDNVDVVALVLEVVVLSESEDLGVKVTGLGTLEYVGVVGIAAKGEGSSVRL